MRKVYNFNDGWIFFQHDLKKNESYLPIQKYNFEDSDWRKVTLPHDSSIESSFNKDNLSGPRGGYATTTMCYYRKHFVINEKEKAKQLIITFNGILCKASVYINEKLLGTYPYGYTSISYDISKYLNYGSDNLIAVRVNNEVQPASRWYTGTGIYRDVFLTSYDTLHINENTIKIINPVCNSDTAVLQMQVPVLNNTKDVADICIKVSLAMHDLYNNTKTDSALISSAYSSSMHVGKDMQNIFEVTMPVSNPHLWSAEDPFLYDVIFSIIKDGICVDKYVLPYGIRAIEFSSENGFLINGKKEILKGVCLHHDNGCLGACAYKEAFKRKLEIMKKMGANAIRTTHNPEDPGFLNLCDELGFYVMEEAFDEWELGKRPRVFGTINERRPIFAYAQYFNEYAQKDLQAMVYRDRNHPSIVMWSIGNEIEELRHSDWEPLTTKLTQFVHEVDMSRPVLFAGNGLSAINDTKNPDIVDVCGYNYAEEFYADDHKLKPNRKIVGSETASITPFDARGEYHRIIDGSICLGDNENADPEEQGAMVANVTGGISRFERAENSWKKHRDNPFTIGLFIWTGIDYLGEPTPEIWPSISSYFAPVDRALFPKDAFYFYQSIWSSKNVLRVFPRWNLSESRIGTKIPICCFTNCDEVELFINDKSMGTIVRNGKLHLLWPNIEYVPGTLKVVGKRNGETVKDIVHTAGDCTSLKVKSDKTKLKINEFAYVTVSAYDKNEFFCESNKQEVEIIVSDNLKIMGIDNGDPTYHIFQGNKVKLFNGLARIIVKATKEGSANITVINKKLKSSTDALIMVSNK